MAKKKASKKQNTPRGALTATVNPTRRERMDVQVRKISNGYLVTQSSYKGDTFQERETFTKTKPKITMGSEK